MISIVIFQECQQKHEAYRWCSQPVFNKNLHGGDLQIASSLLCSGNNFSKLALFAKFLKLHFLDKDSYSNLQEKYLVPTIDSFWRENQNTVVESLKGENVVALGMWNITITKIDGLYKNLNNVLKILSTRVNYWL